MTTVLHEPTADPRLWTADSDPAELGALQVLGGLHITGLPAPDAEEGDHPALFLLLGHHRWATIIHAATLYMDRAHAWRCWCLYPGDDPDETIPRAVHTHTDDTWRLAWAGPASPAPSRSPPCGTPPPRRPQPPYPTVTTKPPPGIDDRTITTKADAPASSRGRRPFRVSGTCHEAVPD
ncbi:hypothetical protein [Streptomyces cinereoruber]|uniref:hypothetical protein n=1 Tax=Streptomyces cinereoruber TaxID=67260 RepID=UPI003626E21E